jgi:hypothetical protein
LLLYGACLIGSRARRGAYLADLPLFRPDIFQVAAERASVWALSPVADVSRWSLLLLSTAILGMGGLSTLVAARAEY